MDVRESLEDLAVGWITCPHCEAPRWQWCRTKSGRHAPQLHAGRTTPIYNAYGLGYSEAEADYRDRS